MLKVTASFFSPKAFFFWDILYKILPRLKDLGKPQVTPPTQTWFAKNTGPISLIWLGKDFFFVSFTLALAMILVLKLHQTREWSFLPSDNPLLSFQEGTIYTFKNGLYLADNHFSSPDQLLRDPHHTLEDCG